MDNNRHLGMSIHQLSHLIHRKLEGDARDDGSTKYHGRVMCYLIKNRGKNIYQRDIEKEFGIRRSTVTRLLQLMESNGLIERETVSSDARLKKIVITEKGIRFDEQVRGEIELFEKELTRDFTPQELEEFFRLMDKLKNTLTEMDNNKRKEKYQA